MTLYGEPRIWLERFPLGELVSISQEHLGIRYPGQVIRTDAWSAEMGQPLEGEIYFRIVLLRPLSEDPHPVLNDPRIAVCLPGSGFTERRLRNANEVSTIRETRAVYLTQRDNQADLIRQTLQRRLETLEEQMLGEESVLYSEGRTLTGSDAGPAAPAIFAGLDPEAWFSRLAQWLLAQSYPSVPVSADLLPGPVDADIVGSVFGAAFGQRSEATEALAQFGPGLGLSKEANPGVFDPSECPVFDLIRANLGGSQEVTQWRGVHHYLAHDVGLTGPMATLYLLIYLRSERPESQVNLSPGRQAFLEDGRPIYGKFLTADMIPALVWDTALGDWAENIGPAIEPEWNDALTHLVLLCPGLELVARGEPFVEQEQALLEEMRSLTEQIKQVQELLAALGQTFDPNASPTASIGNVDEALGRLSSLSGCEFRAVYQSVRSAYPDYRGLEVDLAIVRDVAGLHQSAPDVFLAQEYLRQAVLPKRYFLPFGWTGKPYSLRFPLPAWLRRGAATGAH